MIPAAPRRRWAAVGSGLEWLGKLLRSDAFDWLLVVLLAIYILIAVYDWRLPDRNGQSFGPIWAGLSVVGIVLLRIRRGRFEPVAALAVEVAVAAVLTNSTQFYGQFLRDLGIYLSAGEHFSNGQPVYLTTLITQAPADKTAYPYLYPPLTLPFLGLLAGLPEVLISGVWLLGSAAIGVGGLRLVGLPWRWAIAGLLWPPFFQGLYVGNVAVPAFGLFAAAPWFGAGLIVAATFKPYSGVAALWLVRERRFGQLVAGIAIVGLLALITLPLVGLGQWQAWVQGIRLYTDSEQLVPGALLAMALEHYFAQTVWLVAAALAIGWAWLGKGLDGLARFGVATVVGSPSLHAHGFLVVVPAFLGLRTPLAWVAFGITSVAPGLGWWMSIVLVVIASVIRPLRRARNRVWPTAPPA